MTGTIGQLTTLAAGGGLPALPDIRPIPTDLRYFRKKVGGWAARLNEEVGKVPRRNSEQGDAAGNHVKRGKRGKARLPHCGIAPSTTWLIPTNVASQARHKSRAHKGCSLRESWSNRFWGVMP